MTDFKIQIRAYETADLSRLSSIWFDASQQAHPFLGAARLRKQGTLIENVYLPNSETWVACEAGESIGFISLLGTSVGGLFIEPRLQGGGVGRALITHALKLKGELSLEVYAANVRAYKFYQRLGFEEITRRAKDDEGLPFENVQMRLTTYKILEGADN
ncbi:MAG: GNAT family N-acetyltransferase [Parasphingorhabdus sp.]|uniref:GNAT family N-acetyltransferase n=1 Tax=Parasphingorhabdus sp. TaxID=2709688 RepID=UPI0032998307